MPMIRSSCPFTFPSDTSDSFSRCKASQSIRITSLRLLQWPKISDQWSGRQQCQLSYISEYNSDIRHVSGQENNVADFLSRSPISALHEGVNFQERAADQERDPEIQASRTAVTNLQLRNLPLSGTSVILLCDING